LNVGSLRTEEGLGRNRSLPAMKTLLEGLPLKSSLTPDQHSRAVLGGLVWHLAATYLYPEEPFESVPQSLPADLNLLVDAAHDFARFSGEGGRLLAAHVPLAELADSVLPEHLGELYQSLRRPVARAVSAAALSGAVKISGADALAVTQFFTDDYMVRWLTATALGNIPSSEACEDLVVIDPAVGGGAFLISAHRHILSMAGPFVDRRALSESLLADRLRGYDLDPFLAQLATFALWLESMRETGVVPAPPACIRAGGHSVGGSLDRATLDQLLADRGGRRLAFLTNPPFLARRLMGSELKTYLEFHFPLAGNDLCAAFLQAITDVMAEGDVLAAVYQSTIRHLQSLEGIRRYIGDRQRIVTTVDVGSKAFREISGEKVRASLSIMVRKAGTGAPSSWPEPTVDLSRMPREMKIQVLEDINNGAAIPASALSQENEFRLRVGGCAQSLSTVARPMQGSSTGDNKQFVRYSWEVHRDDPDWRQTSKGGGYSRWAGLRRYVVLWGEEGGSLRRLPGSALRNPKAAASAQIVWSDTGTLGLAARIQPEEDIFIASGPGILVEDASKWSLAAVLNSRIATAWIRFDNPKLTITPSAIGGVPLPAGADKDPMLEKLARLCHGRKLEVERHFPDTVDWEPSSLAVDSEISLEANTEDFILKLLKAEREKLKFEYEIEQRLGDLFGGRSPLRRITDVVAGRLAWELPKKQLEPTVLCDHLRSVPIHLRSASRSHRGSGSDGLLEYLSLTLGIHPDSLMPLFQQNQQVRAVLHRFSPFLVHHEILRFTGFTSERSWDTNRVAISDLNDYLMTRFRGVSGQHLNLAHKKLWQDNSSSSFHSRLFRGHPVLRKESRSIVLKRNER
jgi:hypothetical protein